MSQFEQGSKAIRLLVFGVPTDVVCADRFQARSQMHREERIAALEKLYKKYPGARNAARVAKWLFRDLKGLEVEYVMADVARDSNKTWSNRAKDGSGWWLFDEVVQELGASEKS